MALIRMKGSRGEKPEGKSHYNPGNQSGKEAENVPKKEAEKDDESSHDRP
jgi:hypothetical protein